MIRTRTTFIVGAGASCELELPSNDDLLVRIGQSFDFSRFGSGVQVKDSVLLAQYLQAVTTRLGQDESDIHAAAERIRIASKLTRSIDSLLDQHDTDPLITAAGKLAIVHFICQAEAKSILLRQPRMKNDLPIQGSETWLYQLGQLVTSGVSRSQVERCLDNFAIICFNYDRSIEHFLPHAMVMAFGMDLKEAQEIVAARLRIIHPHGTVGRLPWQRGDTAACEWGTEQPANIHDLAALVRTSNEIWRSEELVARIRGTIANSKRLVFLGFGFQPQNLDLLIDARLAHVPEVAATVHGLSAPNRLAVTAMLRRKLGAERDELRLIQDARCVELMRDYNLMLES